MPDHGDDFLGGMWIDTGKRLVEHGEAGFAGQRYGDLAAAALAARQFAYALRAFCVQPEFRDQFVKPHLARRGVRQTRLQHQQDVLLHRQPTRHEGRLRQIGDAETGAVIEGHGGDVVIVEQDRAGIRRHHSGQHIESRGLARTVGTEQAHDFAALKPQGHIFYDPASGKSLHQMLRRKHEFLFESVGCRGRRNHGA